MHRVIPELFLNPKSFYIAGTNIANKTEQEEQKKLMQFTYIQAYLALQNGALRIGAYRDSHPTIHPFIVLSI